MSSTLHLLSGGAAQGLVQRLAPAFEQQHRCQVAGTFGAVGAMQARLLAGEPCDVLILTQALIDKLAADGRVDASTVTPLGVVKTGVAVPAGRPRPDVKSPDALRAALRAATAIYLPDPVQATAGIHFMKVLKGLGVHDDLAARLRPYPNGATAMRAMAESGDPGAIGCTQVTEILLTPGVQLVDVLPAEFELATVYTAAVARRSTQADAALAFVRALVEPGASAVRAACGFEARGA